jgi:hypothetical protein
MDQLARVGNFFAFHWTELVRGDRYHCRCLPSQGDKFNLIRLVARIDMNYGANVPRLETIRREGCRQNHAIMFQNHDRTILEGGVR